MIVYISYAQEDNAYGNRFKMICKPIEGQIGFSTWSMQDSLPGALWQRGMADHLRQAFLFVPLVSSDWLASDRCQAELSAALQLQQRGQLRIASVLLRPSMWDYSPLPSFPALPSNGKEITRWPNQDTAWVNVQSDLIKIVKSCQIS